MQIVPRAFLEFFCLLEDAVNGLAVEVKQVYHNSFPMHNVNRLFVLILKVQVSDLQRFAFANAHLSQSLLLVPQLEDDVYQHFLLISEGAVDNGGEFEVDAKITQYFHLSSGQDADGYSLDLHFCGPLFDYLHFGRQLVPRLIERLQLKVALLLDVGIVDLPNGQQVRQLDVQCALSDLYPFFLVAFVGALASEV